MFDKIFYAGISLKTLVLGLFLTAAMIGGCSVAAKNNEPAADAESASTAAGENDLPVMAPPGSLTKNSAFKGRIQIKPDSPADAVRLFYKNLREKRFREAMMMTNLRPAVENLTDEEMQDLSADFEPLARQVPQDIQINGEIVTGKLATVTAKMPDDETGLLADRAVSLRREGESWVILTGDEAAEALAKKEGKNYFFALRIEVHHAEAQLMLERIAKAQMVYALQNNGAFAEMQTLVKMGLLAEDVQTTHTTGYRYQIVLSSDKKKYFATAEPAVYAKTGKLSFLIEVEGADKKSRFKSQDNKGQPLKK